MQHENVGVSITGNSTNPTRFQHLVAGTYKKWANETALSISRLHQAAAQAVHFTPITWVQVLLHTVLQTQWAECTVTLSSQVHLLFLLMLNDGSYRYG